MSTQSQSSAKRLVVVNGRGYRTGRFIEKSRAYPPLVEGMNVTAPVHAVAYGVVFDEKSNIIELKSNHTFSHNIFKKSEIEVLKLVVANSQKATLTSIDELNKVLGVTKKNVEIQKKQRSDVISSINKKYSYIKNGNGELIERKQAEFDKRSFEYYIDYNKLSEIKDFI